MRLLVFFDLPVETAKQRKEYRKFRKYLIKEGFLMLQESVYAKLVVNDASAGAAIARMRKQRPPAGLVQVLKITERQYRGSTVSDVVAHYYNNSYTSLVSQFVEEDKIDLEDLKAIIASIESKKS